MFLCIPISELQDILEFGARSPKAAKNSNKKFVLKCKMIGATLRCKCDFFYADSIYTSSFPGLAQ